MNIKEKVMHYVFFQNQFLIVTDYDKIFFSLK